MERVGYWRCGEGKGHHYFPSITGKCNREMCKLEGKGANFMWWVVQPEKELFIAKTKQDMDNLMLYCATELVRRREF